MPRRPDGPGRGLAGRHVVVTRAADQADELVALLEAAGAVAVVVPLIEIIDQPDELEALTGLDLTRFEWLIVTSPNAARYVSACLGDQLEQGDQLDQGVPAVAAIGAATAAVLGDHRCRLVPETQSAVGLLAELPPPATHGAEVLVVHAVDASATLVDGLDAAGWAVTSIAPYRSVAARLDARAQLAALRADAVLFASGSAARGWVAQFGTTTPAIVVAMGPQTAADATQLGLKIDVVAADHSLVGMVAALQRTFGESN